MRDLSLVESIIRAASAATRCRQAAAGEDTETVSALMRAADRYSRRVAELADQLAAGALK